MIRIAYFSVIITYTEGKFDKRCSKVRREQRSDWT